MNDFYRLFTMYDRTTRTRRLLLWLLAEAITLRAMLRGLTLKG